ncbi:MAG: hypothetical protein Q8O36_01700, partial [Candidatus Omnitrophota bacterium]|nr:hypothetical protein [Candidatus Omnitrophota bacterium]
MKNRLLILVCSLVCFLAVGHAVCAQDTPVEVINESNPIISLDYKDADVNAVLRSLAWSYGLNLVTSTDVKGKVTINLRNVTLN